MLFCLFHDVKFDSDYCLILINDIERNYSPGSFGSKLRVSRCFSPPPPDIARVVNCVMSEEYYVKKDDNQVFYILYTPFVVVIIVVEVLEPIAQNSHKMNVSWCINFCIQRILLCFQAMHRHVENPWSM